MARSRTVIRWLLPRLALALLVPALLLAGTEAALRFLGWGYPTSFLMSADVDGKPMWVNNPFYGYRFFPPELARNPPPIACHRNKPADVVRVVVLGESAAMGDPVIDYGAPRMLEKMLNYSGTKPRFEVINAAMTAIHSPVIADIASELDRLSPDIVILYIGNNEVVGPYGPGAVFDASEALWLTPLRIRLSRLRLAQALRAVRELTARPDTGAHHFGMHLFDAHRMRADDPRLEPMYSLYENRLARIIASARAAGAEVLLCTVAVNLTACGPFASELKPDLDPASRQAWVAAYERGVRAQELRRHEEALGHFLDAAALDDRHAELMYLKAQTLSALGRPEEAALLFARARDLDTLRFRADSRINRIIRDTAQHLEVELVDVETSFSAADCSDLFLDHVHFTFAGAYRIADEWFGALASRHPHLVPPSIATCRDRTLFTPWGEQLQALIMYDRRAQPPLVNQVGNEPMRQSLAAVINQATSIIRTTDLQRVRALYEENVARDPRDVFYPTQWGSILMTEGHADEAIAVLTQDPSRMAHHFELRIMPAHLLGKAGEPERAAAILMGDGPPYGWYLAHHTHRVMTQLEADGMHAEARRLGEAVLESVRRFPGRDQLEARVR